MVIRFSSHFVTLFILLNVLYSRGSGFPSLGTYSNLRLGNAVALDGESNEDQLQSPVKTDSDMNQSPLRTTRHADGLFNSKYRKLLAKLAARKYLESLIGKEAGASNGNITVKRDSDAVFMDNYSRIRKQMAVKK
ncbi:VIP peptides-like [Scyliorhinus canicula]|uniref:VIP peptides-like n=1 Tax=Scyliorhinus canicula TaxID=7830 RepID=UPI0018F5A36D|nr:VIP peptides-like [Scyliorhinus canicula]XP_038672897.1 VIP peptides-like [Scyliorhinus canicula]XP_038672903.1 VIP peptides-like [Scyliorhinus canicula]XP_038672911.1 VIP peptides-like [Scyliorhinus canicula]